MLQPSFALDKTPASGLAGALTSAAGLRNGSVAKRRKESPRTCPPKLAFSLIRRPASAADSEVRRVPVNEGRGPVFQKTPGVSPLAGEAVAHGCPLDEHAVRGCANGSAPSAV